MNREEIIVKVKTATGMDTAEVQSTCRDWIDYVQDDIASRHDWSFLTAYNYIVTAAMYDTGTIAVTNGSTAVTGTDTVWTSSMAGRMIELPDGNIVEIASVESGTELTLKSAYAGDDSSGDAYSIRQVYYSLASDFKKMKWITRIEPASKKLPPIPEMNFSDVVPNPYQSAGEIVGYMFAGEDASGNTRIKFWPVQTEQKMVQYSYIKLLPTINTEGAESILPSRMHQLFVFSLAYYCYDMADVMNKATTQKAYYEEALNKFIKEDMDKSLDMVDVMADERSVKTPRIPTVSFTPDHFQRY